MINEHYIDDFLCVERHLDLSMELGEYKINIVPYKAHFLVTVYKDGIEIEQEAFNYWNEAFNQFKDLCNKFTLIVFNNRINKIHTEEPPDPYTDYGDNPNDDISW